MNNDNIYLNKEENFMETPQEIIDTSIKQVEEILKEKFDEFLTFGKGTYTISRGSTQVMIIVRPFTESETCIECIANVVSGAELSPKLMQFLLRKNAEIHFGAFGLLFDNSIVFQQSLSGSNANADEIYTAINTVAIIADHYDDIIVAMAGGKRSIDILENIEES